MVGGRHFSSETKKFSMENQKYNLAYIKNEARKLKKEKGISHSQALEKISKEYGYSNWAHCQRVLSQQVVFVDEPKVIKVIQELSFTDWLKKHKNRDSSLGDLATDMLRDSTWPLHDTLEDYRRYLSFRSSSYVVVETLERAWKSYKAYLKRKKSLSSNKPKTKKTISQNQDLRRVVFVKNVTPLHYSNRIVEKFVAGDKAWISWDGRKAIPITVTEVDGIYYSVKIERPLKWGKSERYLRLDEVRSTPELACINCVTS